MPIVIDPPASPPAKAPSEDGSNLWEILYASLAPLNNPDPDEALLKFCQALCEPLQPIYDLVRERDDQAAWAILLDPDNCPAASLPYLAQYTGAILTPGMDEAQQRAEIGEPTSWKRGQEPAIRLMIQRTLTGTKQVTIHPRTPEVGHHYIRTLASETPSEARTAAVARQAVPAWEALDYAVFTDFTLDDFAAKWTTLAEAEAAYGSMEAIPNDVP